MKSNELAGRGSLEAWLGGAYRSLIESGIEAVRIAPLAKRVRLSRTSFYWFFKDREKLLLALIERWRAQNTGNLVKQTASYAESVTEATLNVFDCWLDRKLFDSELEFAMRSWALQSAKVAAEIGAADTERLDALKKMFIRFGYEAQSADVRARTFYLTQIGYISMKTREDLPSRMSRIASYVEIFTGQAPQQRELARFFARHGYTGRQLTGRRRIKRAIPPAPR